MLGLFTIFTGFEGGSKRNSGELNEIYLGFSRDGFNWWRPQPRTPVARMAWPVHGWNNNGVQTVAAGLHVLEEELRLYTSGRSGMPFDSSWGGGNTTMGLWQMRRDGFVSLEDVCEPPFLLLSPPSLPVP